MSSGFDPCKQWLGIDALSLGDPWLVLGVDRSETNPLAIVRAADAKLAILRGVPPGPLTLARDALVKRVEAARDELLAGAAHAAETASTPAAPARPMFAPPPVPMAPPVPVAPLAPPVNTAKEPATIRLSKKPVAPQSSGSHVVVAMASLLAVVVAAVVAYRVLEARKPKPVVATRKVMAPKDSKPESSRSAQAKQTQEGDEQKPEHPIKPKPTRNDDEKVPEPSVTMRNKPKPDADDADETSAPDRRPPSDSDPDAEPQATTKPMRKPDQDATVDDPKVRPKPQAEPDAEPSKPNTDQKPEPDAEPAKPKPKPTPEPKPEPDSVPANPPPTTIPEPAADPAEKAAAVTKLLREAHAALREHEFDTADAALKTAMEKADDDKLAERVTCFRQLAAYAKQFVGYQEQALKAAADGGIYELPGGRQLSVVEINDKELVYKEGINKRIPRDKIPPAWIQVIITKWFAGDDQAGNHVFLGVYHALKEKPDMKAAQNEWTLAQFGGENVKFLMPLVRDPILNAPDDAAE